MTAKTRIYAVVNKATKTCQLVRSYSPAQARSFAAQKLLHVEVASQEVLVNLLAAGKKVEDAGAPETADAFTPSCSLPCQDTPAQVLITDTQDRELSK